MPELRRIHMTIDTLNTILFPPFLFIVLYGGACCWLYSPQLPASTIFIAPGVNFAARVEALSTAWDAPPDRFSHSAERAAWDALARLSKRKARQLCAPLGIQQKIQGLELSASSMVAAIREKFQEQPDRVAALIRDRFPELLSERAIG
jgi:hypothetical protein